VLLLEESWYASREFPWQIPQVTQMTGAAFQSRAVPCYKPADPTSHTPVSWIVYTTGACPSPVNTMVDPGTSPSRIMVCVPRSPDCGLAEIGIMSLYFPKTEFLRAEISIVMSPKPQVLVVDGTIVLELPSMSVSAMSTRSSTLDEIG